MVTIWRHLTVLVPLFVLFILVMVFSAPKESVVEKNILDEIYMEIRPFITPQNAIIWNYTESTLGLNRDSILTSTDITLFQERVAKEIITMPGNELVYPSTVLELKQGSHFSKTVLLYSLILSENNVANSYILSVDLKYDGDAYSREHSSVLTFFGDKCFLSDVTLPLEKLSYVCRLNMPNRVIPEIVENTYVAEYRVLHAISAHERVEFKDDYSFYNWMLFKTGGKEK